MDVVAEQLSWAARPPIRRLRRPSLARPYAASAAATNTASSTAFNSHLVAPIRPHPPATGANARGAISQNASCASRSSMKFTSRPSPARVAKIRRGVLKATRSKWGASLTLMRDV
jgi:hypothetical protein